MTLPTQGQIESQISEMINKFEQEYMGRGSTRIFTYLVADLLIIRLTNVLTVPERQLVKNEVGASLLKGVRAHLIKMAIPHIEAIVQSIEYTRSKRKESKIVCMTNQILGSNSRKSNSNCKSRWKNLKKN